jgi:hypothetical protein
LVLHPRVTADTHRLHDLVILAPTLAECREDHLRRLVQRMVEVLADDGVGYVLAPPRWRHMIGRLLRAQGLTRQSYIQHVPDWRTSSWLVPLKPRPARYAVKKLLPMPSLRKHLAIGSLSGNASARLLGMGSPSAALVARRPGARPLFAWLARHVRPDQDFDTPVMRRSWRAEHGATILYCFTDNRPVPTAIAKTSTGDGSTDGPVREAALLARLGAEARSAGADVPQAFNVLRLGHEPILLQSMLPGDSVASLLAAKPGLLTHYTRLVADWLGRWNTATARPTSIDPALLDRELLAPAELLASRLRYGTAYGAWLREQCHAVVGVTIPVVALHGDLTMRNIVSTGPGHVGVIDWETAHPSGLPLTDFFYAMTDAVAVATGQTRPAAFATCWEDDGEVAACLATLLRQHSAMLAIGPPIVDLCMHACWLHHAANEHHAAGEAADRPFLAIVEQLANRAIAARGGYRDGH